MYISCSRFHRQAAASSLDSTPSSSRSALLLELEREICSFAQRISASVAYLLEHMQDVPVLLVPTIGARYGDASTFALASKWGSILPAVWSFQLALRSRGLGSAWTTLHLYREREAAELLGIPHPAQTQAGIFPVAYTKGTDFRPADRSRSEQRFGWNRWPG